MKSLSLISDGFVRRFGGDSVLRDESLSPISDGFVRRFGFPEPPAREASAERG
ncbi:MAG: hypothetical protein ABSG55_03290 [Dehalococcoidia bacterium]|jgi:hypothetical protein